MHIDVLPVNHAVPAERFYGKTVAVVHVLRSVSSIIWAIKNGAEKIIPVADPGEAVSMAARLDIPGTILAGEHDCKMPDGFHLDHSPAKYTQQAVQGKTIIVSSQNTTLAVSNADSAQNVILGAMINRTAVAKRILSFGTDCVIMCAGANGEPVAEDLLCAGAIINAVMNIASKSGTSTDESDMAFVCRTLYRDWKTKQTDITSVASVKELLSRGCKGDIDFCLTADLTDVVPGYANGIIR